VAAAVVEGAAWGEVVLPAAVDAAAGVAEVAVWDEAVLPAGAAERACGVESDVWGGDAGPCRDSPRRR